MGNTRRENVKVSLYKVSRIGVGIVLKSVFTVDFFTH